MQSSLSLYESPGPEVLSVSQLAGELRQALESDFSNLWVEGELSNFKHHSSGHCYFTLKDDQSQLRAVMWRSSVQHLFFRPQDGMLVRVLADASLYEKRGELQLIARSMKLSGEGALQKAFEELKRKLDAEGLFDPRFKKPLPKFPKVIGIVTSESGAALQDILSVVQRRFPCVSIVICPVQVQGMGAAESVGRAIEAFNKQPDGSPRRPDVLIVGRGGGSLEDLWAFNEEVVARAIFASRIPIISAVGHETDFSIADFAADVRAATPSMAAELAVQDKQELSAGIHACLLKMESDLTRRIDRHRQRVRHLVASHGFRRPVDHLRQRVQRVDDLSERLRRFAVHCVELKRRRWKAIGDRLTLLDPHRPLERGYVMVRHDDRVIRRAAELARGDRISLLFHDGHVHADVESTGDQGSDPLKARTP